MRDHNKWIARIGGLSAAVMLAASIAANAADLRLIDAVQKQDPQLVRKLLEQKIDVNARSDDGSTALLWAAHFDDIETGSLLVRAGADPNAANSFRVTALSETCTNASAAFVDLLLKAGANPNTPIATG